MKFEKSIIATYKKEILIGISIAFFFQFVSFIGLVLSPIKRIIYISNILSDAIISLITLVILAVLAWLVHESE